jgi:hypothetical protein
MTINSIDLKVNQVTKNLALLAPLMTYLREVVVSIVGRVAVCRLQAAEFSPHPLCLASRAEEPGCAVSLPTVKRRVESAVKER